MRFVSWNIAHCADAWRMLLDSGADVALLQEAAEPPGDVAARVKVDGAEWVTADARVRRPWRTAVVGLTDAVSLNWVKLRPLCEATEWELGVSRPGTLAAANVAGPGEERVIAVSMYGLWESPHEATDSDWIYADASVHRLISDLAALIRTQDGHTIVAAGDLNVLHGYGERGSGYWAARYSTVFDRMAAMGIPFVGPQSPCGRQADPWPAELPKGSANVPTYFTSQMTPVQAQRQLDFVFASKALLKRTSVHARNLVEEWGPSDHCRIDIEIR